MTLKETPLFNLSVPTGAEAPWPMSSITGHLRWLTFIHWFLRWRAVLPLLFSITNSERRNVLNFIWFFTSKMGHWLLHSAHVPPSSQLFILIHQKQHHSHRFKKYVTNISEVGWIGCVLVIFLTSSIVKNLMDGHTLSCRGALSFQSVWSITQASIDQSLTLKNS